VTQITPIRDPFAITLRVMISAQIMNFQNHFVEQVDQFLHDLTNSD